MSNLFVDKISGKSGTSSGAPITLSGDTATLSSGVTIPAAGITGTLGSGITFPAGHIIQTKMAQIAVAIGSTTTIGASVEVHSDLRIDFTPVSSSSKILFTFHAGNAIAQSADLQVSIRYASSADTAPNTSFGNDYLSGDRQGNTAQIFTFNHITFEDSWTGLRCVSPCYGSSNGNAVTISNHTLVTSFILQEIAQ